MLTIAHISDLHITTDRDPESRHRNEARLRSVLATIHALEPRPSAIIATGDLVDIGDPEEYAALSHILSEIEIPLYLTIGNHDRRAPFLAAFSTPVTQTDSDGFVQFVADVGALRLVVCDTVEEGSNDGAFCAKRAAWLTRALDAEPGRPTIIALHHPPIPSGIDWMDPPTGALWIQTLAGVLHGRSQVRAIICGHVHRPFHGPFAGHVVSVTAATALQLTLNLTPVDRRVADGRQILVGEPPGFALLAWDGARLITHNCVSGNFPDKILYDVPFVEP